MYMKRTGFGNEKCGNVETYLVDVRNERRKINLFFFEFRSNLFMAEV